MPSFEYEPGAASRSATVALVDVGALVWYLAERLVLSRSLVLNCVFNKEGGDVWAALKQVRYPRQLVR